jgi:hypothetical protein
MADTVVTLHRYSGLDEAYIACALLASEGVRAFLQDVHLVRFNWLYSNAIGGIRLQVAEEDRERASGILEAALLAVELGEGGAECCPECGGLDVTRTVHGRRVAFATWLVVGFPLWRPHSEWRCSQCGGIRD